MKTYIKIIAIIIERIEQLNEDGAVDGASWAELADPSLKMFDVLPTNQACSARALVGLLHKANWYFYDCNRLQLRTSEIFFSMKYLELKVKFVRLRNVEAHLSSSEHHKTYLRLMEYVYIEVCYLDRMIELTHEAERKILKKHKKYLKDFKFPKPEPIYRNIDRLKHRCTLLIDEIENQYTKLATKVGSYKVPKKAREFLRSLAEKKTTSTGRQFWFGLWLGLSLALLAVLIVALIYSGEDLNGNEDFGEDFPVWRGSALFIMYIFGLGFNVFMFNKFMINHSLIFKNREHYVADSAELLIQAGFLSSVFLVLFLIYALNMNGIIGLGSFPRYYLPAIVWGIFAVYLFMPLPIFIYRTRIAVFWSIVKSLFSPYLGVDFTVIFTTDQLISLVNPFKDLAYTICFYTERDLVTRSGPNPCKDSSRVEVVAIVGIIAYSFRIMQCLRQGWDAKVRFVGSDPSLNFIKYSVSLITLVLSFMYTSGESRIFVAWVVFAAFTTIYSYCWDMRQDWALGESKFGFLRKKLTYEPRELYYCLLLCNLVLRLAWVLTTSPQILSDFYSPELFGLITALLEIFRRVLWNLVRVEKEHLANCRNFTAFPSVQYLEKDLPHLSETDRTDTLTQLLPPGGPGEPPGVSVPQFLPENHISNACLEPVSPHAQKVANSFQSKGSGEEVLGTPGEQADIMARYLQLLRAAIEEKELEKNKAKTIRREVMKFLKTI